MLVFRRLSTLRPHAKALFVARRGYSFRMPQTEGDSSGSGQNLEGLRIEVVDDDSWRVSAGLAEAWRGSDKGLVRRDSFREDDDDGVASYATPDIEDPDFDDVEDMRIRGSLYYKVDKDSKEYEECNVDLFKKKSQKEKQKDSKKKEDEAKAPKKEKMNVATNHSPKEERFPIPGFREKMNVATNDSPKEESFPIPGFREMGSEGKRLRNPTFNQLTGPYHEPFCLDIYVSKGSVRASVIHRATSKVVAVAHSISKDMKFDLGSTKSDATCVAVGEVLARRALEDDIHNVVYTPRKGERLEGKLKIVLDSIVGHGVSVKVKLKQRKPRKVGLFEPKPQF